MFFKKIDIFGQKIEFYFQKKKNVKTIFGGIITTFISAFLLYLAYYFSEDLIYKINPVVRMNQVYINDSFVSMDNLIFAIDFFDSNANPIPNITKYLRIEAQYWDISTDEKQNLVVDKKVFPNEKCNLTKHFSTLGEDKDTMTKNIPLNRLTCFDIPKNFSLRNGFLEFPVKFFTIVIFTCSNKTDTHGIIKLYNFSSM
jgi:hypothetical protein